MPFSQEFIIFSQSADSVLGLIHKFCKRKNDILFKYQTYVLNHHFTRCFSSPSIYKFGEVWNYYNLPIFSSRLDNQRCFITKHGGLIEILKGIFRSIQTRFRPFFIGREGDRAKPSPGGAWSGHTRCSLHKSISKQVEKLTRIRYRMELEKNLSQARREGDVNWIASLLLHLRQLFWL